MLDSTLTTSFLTLFRGSKIALYRTCLLYFTPTFTVANRNKLTNVLILE